MQAGKAVPFAQRYQTLAPVVEQAFDLGSILETSVGRVGKAFHRISKRR